MVASSIPENNVKMIRVSQVHPASGEENFPPEAQAVLALMDEHFLTERVIYDANILELLAIAEMQKMSEEVLTKGLEFLVAVDYLFFWDKGLLGTPSYSIRSDYLKRFTGTLVTRVPHAIYK